jgi:hypothetical protein
MIERYFTSNQETVLLHSYVEKVPSDQFPKGKKKNGSQKNLAL